MTADYCPCCGLTHSHWNGCEYRPSVLGRVLLALLVIGAIVAVILLAGTR